MDMSYSTNDFSEYFRSSYENIKEEIWKEEIEELQKDLAKRLVITFMGTVACGKSTAIKKLFSLPIDNISPIPGTTEKVKIFQIRKNVYVADTPGLLDIRSEISGKTQEFIDLSDIFIFILNSSVALTEKERDEIYGIVSLNKPLLVLINKIDLLKENVEIENIYNYVCGNLPEIDQNDVIPVAFENRQGNHINLEKVIGWIVKTLSISGKEILFSKAVKFKAVASEKLIKKSSLEAGTIGALPIPGSDITLLTALQIRMIVRMAEIYGKTIDKNDISLMLSSLLAGNTGKSIYRYIITLLKAGNWIPGGQWSIIITSSVAFSLSSSITYGVGKSFQYYFENDMKIAFEDMEEIFLSAYETTRQGKGGE